MFCFVYKWLISRSLDSKKRLSGPVTRHIRRCRECREFLRVSESLNRRLVRDAGSLPGRVDGSLNKKVLSALTVQPVSVSAARRLVLPVPVLVAASVVVLVAFGIIFRPVPVVEPGTDQDLINSLSTPAIFDTPFQDLFSRVESPIDSEMENLKQSVSSASSFILSCLDVQL